ncbi:MAG TPA: porin [Cyanobacteria bacterium UBA11149]|nr:porin [Cyanobacteria bacterium UBA11367]HBE58096.1 porin [Cyanobacteria bacterium UBA11366]HBR74657.1 porin [Cyanobacteria bacterium UBA11159]HBS69977.1 porin [Cyanobacteria bacterium UBA11153]HBW91640.1 porin [Cyanobacteria bacterium UBA11149]HCA95570.1 porin [Cyanobacteria bacterium UBA9226]
MAGLLAAPAEAQTTESETVADDKTTSGKIENLGKEESPAVEDSTILDNIPVISAIAFPHPVRDNRVNLEAEVPSEIDSSDRLDGNKLPTTNKIETLQANSVISSENLANSGSEIDSGIEEKITSVSVLAQAVPPDSNLGSFELDETEANPMGQVTNVSQLRDVSPGDWAYEALRNLVERYGCIAGYPDGTFRGNRAMSRYEFAAGLNACLQQVERLMTGVKSGVPDGDLEALQRLTEEFKPELATLASRVDNLEFRTAFLEDHQFSPTTKLFGQVVIGIQGRTENTADFFPVDGIKDTKDPGTNINLISNAQLSLFTQFSPNSILLTGLQAGNGDSTPFLTNNLRLGYEGNTGGDLVLSDLTYRHRFGKNFGLIVGTAGINPVNVFRGTNRVESAGFGPISLFAQRNPIINMGGGTGGIGFDWQVNPRISLQGVYAAGAPENPGFGGIFGGTNGETVAGVQLIVSPINSLDIAFHYLNAYSPFGRLGSQVGDDFVAVPEPNFGLGGILRAPLQTNAIGTTISWRVNPKLTLGGWVGYTNSKIPGRSGNVETINWMAFINLPDLLGEGNLGGIYVGQPPRITSSDLPVGRNVPDFLAGGIGVSGDQPGTTTHLEIFYRFRVSENISITPGFVLIFDPANTPNSDTIAVGAIRTTFTF